MWIGAALTVGLLVAASMAQGASVDHGSLESNSESEDCKTTVNEREVSSEGNWASVNVGLDLIYEEYSTKEDQWDFTFDIQWIQWPNGPLGGDVQPGASPGDKSVSATKTDTYDETDEENHFLAPVNPWTASDFLYDGKYKAEVTGVVVHKLKEWTATEWQVHCDSPAEARSANLILDWTGPAEDCDDCVDTNIRV